MASIFNKQKRSGILDLKTLQPAAIIDEISREFAFGMLELNLVNPAVDKLSLVEELYSTPHLLEFVVSAIPQTGFQSLIDWISHCVPDDPRKYEDSILFRLLSRFALCCGALPFQSPELDECQRAVELAPRVLKELTILWRVGEAVEVTAEEAVAKGKAKRVPQRVTKKAKRAGHVPQVDVSVFTMIEVAVPSSQEEAVALAQQILIDQSNVLKHYFNVLRKPEASAIMQKNYLDIITQTDTATTTGLPHTDEDVTGFPDIIPETEPQTTFEEYSSQPVQNALFFASAEGFGDWRLMMAQRVIKYLEDTRKRNPKAFKIAVKKMRELSHGHFSADNQKRLEGSDNGLPIFEAKMSRDTRLIYRVDCIQELGSDVETQVLRLYGIYTHAEMGRTTFWKAMSQAISGAGSEYRRRCLYRNPSPRAGDEYISPASWPPMEEAVESVHVDLPDLTIQDKQELRSMLDLEKLTPCSQALLSSIAANEDPSHPFHLSRHEQSVVLHPGSTFIFGRSGTGKTTTMMFKMVFIERSWRKRKEGEEITAPPPRQIFITQSPVLADKAQDYHQKVLRTVEAETRSLKDSEGLAGMRTQAAKSGLYDKDEAEEYREDLPKTFSELKSHHFPLFISFHRLCRLLEADMIECDADMRRRLWPSVVPSSNFDEDDVLTSNDYMLQRRESFVSYNVFLEEYWRHFPQSLTKGLNPVSVFAEFMGIIRGSEQALRNREGYLDRDSYCALSHRIGTMHASKESVYSLFEAYVKRKMHRREYDAADRTQMILQSIRKHGVPGEKVDFVYVDEVQDNLLIDTLVLRAICRRPTGLFWAGDTAQTISAGSSFRFNDLPALMFRVEKGQNTHNPHTFYLNRNFRSQAGIVHCAQTVLDAIMQIWPYSVDVIAPEKGMLDGQTPLFIGGVDFDVPHFEQFMCRVDSESGIGNTIEFGDQQCIIVRNEEAREKLRAEFGDVGVIMTLYETKGLEFEDVLLYNFFADSTVSAAQWRVVLKGLEVKSPTFDEEKHDGVCHELKCLYVACTRARLNLWIVDYSGKGEPMRTLWQSRNQIETWVPGARIPVLAQSESSPERWAATAERLFHVSKNYKEAMIAYGRAGEKYTKERAAAEAYHLRELARRDAANFRKKAAQRHESYSRAAQALQRVAEDDLDEEARRSNFRSAAECFVRAQDHIGAARCFEQIPNFTRAAECYYGGGLFDDAVRLVKTRDVDPTLKEKVIRVSAVHYIKKRQLSKATALLGSEEAVLEHADMYGLDRERASLLEKLNRVDEAAELHLENDNLAEAVQLLTPISSGLRCADRIVQSFMDRFWATTSLGHVSTSRAQLLQQLPLARQLLQYPKYPAATRDLLALPLTLTSESCDSLRLRRQGLKLLDVDAASALLCLDHAFQLAPEIEMRNAPEVFEYLHALLAYLRALQKLVNRPDSRNSIILRRLLAVNAMDNGSYIVRPDSLLHLDTKPVANRTTIRLSPRDLENRMKRVLRIRILDLVRRENDTCKRSRVFSVCLQWSIEGRCSIAECKNIHMTSYSHAEYQLRVALHGLQICIYHTLYGIEAWPTRQDQQRFWLSRLRETLQPAAASLGAWHNVDESSLSAETRSIVSCWLSEGFFNLTTNPGVHVKIPFFLNTFFRSCFLHKLVNGNYIPTNADRIPAVAGPNGDWLLRGTERVDIISDAVRLLSNGSKPLTSGILMVKHIIEQRLPIQAGLLCDILDILCPMLVLAKRGTNMHTLTFPRSWFAQVARFLDGSMPRDTEIIWLYLKPMAELLKQLYTQADHLRLKASDGDSQALFVLRNVYILRVCRNLCLLGYNIRNDGLRYEIHKTLNSIQQFQIQDNRPPFPLTYRRFVVAQSWSELARYVKYDTLGGNGDFLVELIDETRGIVPPPSAPGIRRVVYRHPSEVPALLEYNCTQNPKFAGTEQESRRHTPAENFEISPEELQDVQIAENDVDHIQISDPDSVSFADIQPAQTTPSYSDQDYDTIRAALAIYRKTHTPLNARKHRAMTKASLLRAREFKACLTEASRIDWVGRPGYRMLFLWYLPHVLCSMQGIIASLHGRKAHFKRQLADPARNPLEYDDLTRKITEANEHNKLAHKLYKDLSPRSEFHDRPDRIENLRGIATQIQALFDTLPLNIQQEYASDITLGLRGILVDVSSTKVEKAELNWEDDVDSLYM